MNRILIFLYGVLAGAALATAGYAIGAVITFSNPSIPGAAGITMFPDGAKAITPSDTDTFERCVALYVSVAGNLNYTPCNGGTNVTIAVVAGGYAPSRASAVYSTNTTATVFAVY